MVKWDDRKARRDDNNSGMEKSIGSERAASRSRKVKLVPLGIILGILFTWGAAGSQEKQGETPGLQAAEEAREPAPAPNGTSAGVVSVRVTGRPGAYRFSVGVRSPDEGCSRYADWWEVLTGDGELIYRRILGHSHVEEQPFVRSGGPVPIPEDTVVLVRAHMNPGGYGVTGFKGSVRDGFQEVELEPGFASGLEKEPPQPSGCAF